jgi:serine/threonine protein kinase
MTPQHWQQVKHVFQSAIQYPPERRAAFVDEACANDPTLRSEVDSLISSYDQGDDSIEGMAGDVAVQILADDRGLLIGKNIGSYKIISEIGSGAMGNVFLAQDPRLNRRVALKLLPAEFAQNQDRLRRFQREARAVSALNHPNILTIHEVGRINSHNFIVAEFIDGETLRNRVRCQRLPVREALGIAIQIASALVAAHKAGIVHRDVKPENIMLREDGIVKVLDFGLAKLTQPQLSTTDTEAPTLGNLTTDPGTMMGTVNYMSPEQARGLEVNECTDIFSLGVLIYEMVTGKRPFEGATSSDVIAALLINEPAPMASHVSDIPAELENIVRKCLEKDCKNRYRSAEELLNDLEHLRRDVTSAAALSDTANRKSSAQYIVSQINQHKLAATLVLGVAIVLATVSHVLPGLGSGTQQSPPALINATFTQLTDQAGTEYFPSLSPDGKSFIFAGNASGNWDIYLQRVGSNTALRLTKDSTPDDTQPAFSPDGERIAFRSEREGGGIFVMDATGESTKRLTHFGYNPAWSPDAKEIACAEQSTLFPTVRDGTGGLWVVNVGTGEKRSITDGDKAPAQPNWSPNGQTIAYWSRSEGRGRDIWTIPAGGGQPVLVISDGSMNWNPVWSTSGNHLYFLSDRGGSMNLWLVPIDQQTGKVHGQPQQVTTPSRYGAHLCISADGRALAYVEVINRVNLQRVEFDPEKEMLTGQPVWITQDSRLATYPNLSPDGEWIVFDAQGEKQEDLYLIRRDGTDRRQLTDDVYRDRGPRWAPDGEQIAFFSDRSGQMQIWTINPDGGGSQQLTYTSDNSATRPVWSPDGIRLLYDSGFGKAFIIKVSKPWDEQSPQALPAMSDSAGCLVRSWSPDGRTLAGMQASPGRFGGMQVVPQSGIVTYSLVTQKYEKLTDFGQGPVWLSDNRRLLFYRGDKVYLVDSQSKRVHEVFSIAPRRFRGFSVSRDNRLIYFSIETTEADIWMMTLG